MERASERERGRGREDGGVNERERQPDKGRGSLTIAFPPPVERESLCICPQIRPLHAKEENQGSYFRLIELHIPELKARE
jgi:hypothetical protein